MLFVGARGVILDDQNRLLLIQRSDNHRWAIPAGAMELGESMEECAIREVWEETGLHGDLADAVRVLHRVHVHQRVRATRTSRS